MGKCIALPTRKNPFLTALRFIAMSSPMLLIGCLFLITSLGGIQAAELSKSRDCAIFELDNSINPELTDQENIDRLNNIFMNSVNFAKHCDTPTKLNDAAGGAGSGGCEAGGSTAAPLRR